MRVSLVIPTFNESANIPLLLARLSESLAVAGPSEIIFVDDSTDDTPATITARSRDCAVPITLIHRDRPDGGLGGAVVAGMQRATGEWIVVLDADLQHPPELVPELTATGEATTADLVVASRYVSGGSRSGLGGVRRLLISSASTLLAKGLFARRLRGVSDPMSGFFAVRRAIVCPAELRPSGYKILLELIVAAAPARIAEVPYEFGTRHGGESKSTLREGFRFLHHVALLRLRARRRTRPELAVETP